MMQRHDGPIDQRMLTSPESCLKALAALVFHIRGIKIDIRPSTHITQHIGRLEMLGFWHGVRGMCPERIPRLTSVRAQWYFDAFLCNRGAVLALLLGVAVAYSLVIVRFSALVSYMHPLDVHVICIYAAIHIASIPFLFVLIARAIVPWLTGVLRVLVGRLPHGIETFGELADLVSGNRGGWCLNCGYDMTGMAEERCPECGRENAAS